MNQYERGKHRPDAKTIERLSNALNVPVAYLYCEDDQLAQVIVNYQQLSSADKKKVAALMEKVEHN